MGRVRATVEYDGTDFVGFQRQVESQRSVQGVLEAAIRQITQASVTVMAAGRTDAGVHAAGQVIAFDTEWRYRVEDLERALNAVLPGDVAVRELQQVRPEFHPRFDARSRGYRYTVHNGATRSPLYQRVSWHVGERLDVEAMNAACGALIGEHDFATFGQAPQGENTVRRVLRAQWRSQAPFVVFDIEANAFLYRMVRSLVGTLREVGSGVRRPAEFRAMVVAADRRLAGQTSPPHGLCLMAVQYDEE